MAVLQYEHTKGQDDFDLVSWVLNNHHYDQHAPLYIDPDRPSRCLTAAEVRCLIKRLIAGLKAAGLQEGDVVCLNAFNDIYYPALLLAVIGAGGIYTGCNPSYIGTEIARLIESTKARFVISDVTLISKIADEVLNFRLPATIKVIQFNPHGEELLPGFASWQDLQSHGEAPWITFASQEEAKTTTAALLTTSGTSGMPKYAMHSHQNFIAQTMALDDTDRKPYQITRLIALPIFHAFAFPLAHFFPLMHGTPTYIMRRFDMQPFLNHIHDYAISETILVPTIITNILKSSAIAHKLLRPLRTVWCAGSPLPQLTHNEFFRLLGPTARLLQAWGMTEIGWITTFLWPEKDHSGSVGRLLPGYEAKIISPTSSLPLSDSTQGELHIRGPSLMQRYLFDPTATAATIDRQGWLRTGDIGYREQGKLYIVDRQKELIKVRGWQISPAELEAQLNCHPGVKESAVVGVMGLEMDTEVPRAYVVRTVGDRVSETVGGSVPGTLGGCVGEEGEELLGEREVKAYMSQHLARYKSLDGGVRFVDAIPKTSSGKIVRHVLRKMAAEEMAEEVARQVVGGRGTRGDSVERRHGVPDHDSGETKAPHSIAGTDTSQTYTNSALPSPTSETGTTTSSISECSSGEEADDEDDYGAEIGDARKERM